MFSIGFLTLDLIIILIITAALFFISFTRGEHLLARFILSFYPATLIFSNLPFVTLNGAYTKIFVYAITVILIYMFLAKNLTARRSHNGSKKTFDAVVLSLASVVTILTIYYHILPLEIIYSFTLPVETLFVSTVPYGVWLLIPIFALVSINKGHR